MPPIKSEVILTGIENWDDWKAFITTKIPADIWAAVKPTNRTKTLINEPSRPQASDFNETAETEADLDATQIKAFKLSYEIWKEDNKTYEKQTTGLLKAKEAVFASVDEKLARYLDPEDSLIDWIDCLARAAKAEETKVIQNLAREYRELLQSFSCSDLKTFEDWIWKWENYLLKAARQQMLEVKEGRWLFDIADLMTKHNTSFSDNCRQVANSTATTTKEYENALQVVAAQIKEIESPNRNILRNDHLERLQIAITAIQTAKKPLDCMNAGQEWSIADVAVKLRSWASSALSAQVKTPIRRGTAFQATDNEHNDDAGTRKGRSSRKRPRSEENEGSDKRQATSCEACGAPWHDLNSCWNAIPELRPKGSTPNERWVGVVKRALAKDPELKAKVDKIREAAKRKAKEEDGSD
ncbi:reverse transcriptase [Metarhizium guizhouense ARSEF 977]|uniref:Reverse transcriptase n=1 Tax=Metarhizium guizhouense (strain ARSEF 977) TaxID=1276136 RepID=A0A0B4HS97_METGA|nr:reverse transcriptase [Metarhizium guizhouense ARSEF 977]